MARYRVRTLYALRLGHWTRRLRVAEAAGAADTIRLCLWRLRTLALVGDLITAEDAGRQPHVLDLERQIRRRWRRKVPGGTS